MTKPLAQIKSIRINGFIQRGDIIIGGIFPIHSRKTYLDISFSEQPDVLHCETFEFSFFERFLAMLFGIEEIQRNQNILPNITLGFRVFDSCTTVSGALEGTLRLLSGHETAVPNYFCDMSSSVKVIIGDAFSLTSVPMAKLLGVYRYPQISYSASVMVLSDKNQFPSFLRTIPSDLFQSVGLAHLMLYFGWTWVGLLTDSSDYGQQGSQVMKEELIKAGACIAFSKTMPTVYIDNKIQYLTEMIQKSSTNVIAIYAVDFNIHPIMEELVRNNVTGKVWIASDAWTDSPLFVNKKYFKTFQGTLGFMMRRGEMSGFMEFIHRLYPFRDPENIFLKMFWETVFDCKLHFPETNETITKQIKQPQICTGDERLQSTSMNFFNLEHLRFTYNVYNAIYAVVHALHNLTVCKTGEGPFINNTCTTINDFKPWQIPQSRCSDSCPAGYRKATQPGQPICCFICIMCSQGEISNQSDSTFCLKCPSDQWPNVKQDKCVMKQLEYLSYTEPLGGTLTIVPIFMALTAINAFAIFVKSHNTPVVKANNRELSYVLLISLVLCFLCSLIFIGQPTNLTCMLRQVIFSITFTFSVSCVLAKTVVVVIAFNASKPNSSLKNYAGPRLPKSLVTLCILIQVIICTNWLIICPPFQDKNTTSVTGKIIIECNEGSSTAFWCMLSYMGLLATISLAVAFLSRNLPDSFNEAKYITFSMLIFVSVWMSFIPAYLSTRGKYMVAVEVFAILSSGAALLVCIFIPKCYIILLRPEMNTRDYLMGRGRKLSKIFYVKKTRMGRTKPGSPVQKDGALTEPQNSVFSEAETAAIIDALRIHHWVLLGRNCQTLQQLVATVNNVGLRDKSYEQVRHCATVLIHNARQGAAAVARDHAGTDGGPATQAPLSATEEFLTNLGSATAYQEAITTFFVEVDGTDSTAEEHPDKAPVGITLIL
ncbi:extracellular calcium-sensing receptor-like [Protopterus annectens]|uniref:extracellular calcium-sensing receptor-like n=1 Tax=Protopterus annectens TaxID=7888 RepID=UPI001CF96EC7|nr:extracellular calcium-sensing receptor-like [Protopterus annectens]